MPPKYPQICVQLTGGSGNAGAIMGTVARALAQNNIPQAEINEFRHEAMSGDYDHLLRTAMAWVEVS
jgi:ribosomal protein S9